MGFSIDIRNLIEYLYLRKSEKVKAFGCIWVSNFENKKKALNVLVSFARPCLVVGVL